MKEAAKRPLSLLIQDPPTLSTGLSLLDRMLGGGLVEGSITLLAGRPGTGKTTLTIQVLDGLRQRCLYVTGEETREHVEARARRVGALSDRIHVLAEPCLEEILKQARSLRAQALAIDTIQMLRSSHVRDRPGLLAQLRGCSARLIDYAWTTGTTLWFVGHLTACGYHRGPPTIEHSADVVLRLDQEDDKWILRSSKNRFPVPKLPARKTGVEARLKLTANGFVEFNEERSL